MTKRDIAKLIREFEIARTERSDAQIVLWRKEKSERDSAEKLNNALVNCPAVVFGDVAYSHQICAKEPKKETVKVIR